MKETAMVAAFFVSIERRRDRAAAVAAAIVQIQETAPPHELRAALEAYLDDEFIDLRRQALADHAQYWGDEDA
jgi:hypothetical protein